jgi:predicted DNA-binding transcriptional regulator
MRNPTGGEVMAKDQMIGAAILAVCAIVLIGYLLVAGVPGLLGLNASGIRLDIVLVLVSIGFIAVLGIGGWIGYTMLTTPPPKPIEEITNEIQETKDEKQPAQ